MGAFDNNYEVLCVRRDRFVVLNGNMKTLFICVTFIRIECYDKMLYFHIKYSIKTEKIANSFHGEFVLHNF